MPHKNIFKVGGSLISSEGYLKRVRHYLGQYAEDTNVIICGGGDSVERIREYQRQFYLSEAECHHNSLTVMDRHTRKLCQQLGWPVLDSWKSLTSYLSKNRHPSQPTGFLVTEFAMHHDQHLPLPQLPSNWSATSDSIAARLASLFQARLYLLKSVATPGTNLTQLANQGYVDQHFPIAAANISSLTFVDLSH